MPFGNNRTEFFLENFPMDQECGGNVSIIILSYSFQQSPMWRNVLDFLRYGLLSFIIYFTFQPLQVIYTTYAHRKPLSEL